MSQLTSPSARAVSGHLGGNPDIENFVLSNLLPHPIGGRIKTVAIDESKAGQGVPTAMWVAQLPQNPNLGSDVFDMGGGYRVVCLLPLENPSYCDAQGIKHDNGIERTPVICVDFDQGGNPKKRQGYVVSYEDPKSALPWAGEHGRHFQDCVISPDKRLRLHHRYQEVAVDGNYGARPGVREATEALNEFLSNPEKLLNYTPPASVKPGVNKLFCLGCEDYMWPDRPARVVDQGGGREP